MGIQIYIESGSRVTLDELIEVVPLSQAAKEVAQMRDLLRRCKAFFTTRDIECCSGTEDPDTQPACGECDGCKLKQEFAQLELPEEAQ